MQQVNFEINMQTKFVHTHSSVFSIAFMNHDLLLLLVI